jgi:hypothetical protein
MRNAKPNKDRFDQYKNLELKINQREKFESNEKFLFDSNIILDTVSVTRDNFNIYKNRISELTSRTNQLNYTKVREDVFEIKKRLKHTKNFIFKVKDKYGNYGVVGFASFEKSRKKVYHYLFSCRIINMGIENHAAKTIDLPEFFPDENVISKYEKKACPWIKNGEVEELSANHILKDTLFLGGCDLERSLHFISSKDRIETYFNYITSGGINVHRDSIDLLLIDDIEDDKIDYIISTVPFLKNHKGMGIKDIKNLDFSKYKNIIYSPLIDYNQEKFISKNVPEYYLSSTPALHGEYSEDDLIKLSNSSKINIEELKKMTRHWKPSSKPEKFFRKQINKLFSKFSSAEKVIILLGATNTYSDLDSQKIGRHILYNKIFIEESKKFTNIEFVRPDDYIKSRKDFTNAIRHYSSRVYKCIADDINEKLKK